MAAIQLGQDSTLVFETVLSQTQVSKFNRLVQRLIVIGATPYLRLDELHGVLLTRSRQDATDLVLHHRDLIKNYLVTDKVLLRPAGVQSAIRPMGVYLLLEHLAEVNPKKAIQYRASLSLLSLILSNNSQLLLAAMNASAELDSKIKAVMKKLKQAHPVCQLTGEVFNTTNEKHVHHIESAALNPKLVAEESNLVVIHGWAHDLYHDWAAKRNLPICRQSLGLFAVEKGYSTPFVESLKAG
jgi:hypothetical protein